MQTFTGDPDWAGEPETYDFSDVLSHAINVPMDIGNGRGALTKISIYGILLDSAGDQVDRGTMAIDMTPIELARPGNPGTPGVNGAEPMAIVDGTNVTTAPARKAILDIGPGIHQLVIRVHTPVDIPATAETMRLYWRPSA